MRAVANLTALMVLILLLGLVYSCAEAPVKPPQVSFYVTPPVTYLLDRPDPQGHVMGPLFRGDRVERVDGGDSAWWQVKLVRSEQIGWIRKELLSSEPVAASFYYVNEDTLPLLECPRGDCLSLQLLSRGEQVQRLEIGPQGWWRILVLHSRSTGWVPAAALADRIEEVKRKQAPYYYVAARKLSLRAQPSEGSAAIRTLRFNDQVQKLGQTGDWFQVRQPSSGALGWIKSRHLEPLPLTAPRRGSAREEPKPFIPKEEEPQSEPDFM